MAPQDNRSLGELFAELSRETSTLIRKEIELARTEIVPVGEEREAVRRLADAEIAAEDHDPFDEILAAKKKARGVKLDSELPADALKELVAEATKQGISRQELRKLIEEVG